MNIELDGEAQERRNVANARWSILFNGRLLPITNLFDTDGNQINNPMRACRVVAFDDLAPPAGKWIVVAVDPGEIWKRSHAHAKAQATAQQ